MKIGFRKITEIRTIIHNKRMRVLIKFDDDSVIFLSPEEIQQNTGLQIHELELLINSKLRVEFYDVGEVMHGSGNVCEKERYSVKEYWFNLLEPLEKLRVTNSNYLIPFMEITELFYFDRFNRENVGIKTDSDKVIYVPVERFERVSNLSKSEQHVLVGSYIFPIYFNKGDKFRNGETVNKDNKILKWLNIRYKAKLSKLHEAYEELVNDYDDNDDYNPYDDYGSDSDIIRDVFDGDPSFHWNID